MQWFTSVEKERLERFGFYPVRVTADHVVVESEWQALIARRRAFNDGATRLRWR